MYICSNENVSTTNENAFTLIYTRTYEMVVGVGGHGVMGSWVNLILSSKRE